MSIPLDPLRTYTIFLLPFAYQLDEKVYKEYGEKSNGLTWHPLDWSKTADPTIEEIEDFKKKRGADSALQTNKIDIAVREFVQETRRERSSVWNLQYYMPESNYVLFRRAKRFALCNADSSLAHHLPNSELLALINKSQSGETRTLPIDVHWMRLVLFECSTNGSKNEPELIPFARNGILAIKLGFRSGSNPTLADLLLLNEAFRYYKIPYYQHPNKQYGLRRHDIFSGLPGPYEDTARARSYWEMWDSLLSQPIKDGDRLFYLMPKGWHDNAKVQSMADNTGDDLSDFDNLINSTITGPEEKQIEIKSWDVYPDNRAFVWTCAKCVNESDFKEFPDFPENIREFEKNDFLINKWKFNMWHALLEVDAAVSEIDSFRLDWLKERTYMRWAKEGSLYGFNNYSVALLGNPLDFIVWHFETIYLDMGLMLLQVRTSLFRLSQQISFDRKERIHDLKLKLERIFRKLRGDFASFVNLYQFPLLSTQQQGIEMYSKMRNFLDVDDLYREVKSEIESTHEHAELEAEKSTEKGLRTLTIYGLAIASGALIGQVFGMSYVLHDLVGWPGCRSFLIQFGFIIVFGMAGFFLARYKLNKGEKETRGSKRK